jgi:exodeoxyribonuclease VII large subunit
MSQARTDTPANERDVYTVSRLNREARHTLEGRFPLIWIEGELSNLARPASGHLYFSLKDSEAQVRCAFFRQHQRGKTAALRDGLHVLIRARVSLYEGRGDFQLIVEYLEESGEGALKRAFELLKAKLGQEGLFDQSRKKPLPRLPRRIALVTSPSGAVVHDILTTLQRRFPAIAVRLYPVAVQGEGAAEQVARAIHRAGREGDCQAMIVARGGGSLEDLQAFNEEIVARAIFLSPIPVVTGIGHEVDFTIADFVADARAPTPTAAAELLSPHWEDWHGQYRQLETRLLRLVRDRLFALQQRTDALRSRLVHPRTRLLLIRERLRLIRDKLLQAWRLHGQDQRLRCQNAAGRLRELAPLYRLRREQMHTQHLQTRLVAAVRRRQERLRDALQARAQTLQTLSPLATLARGYAVVRDAATGLVLRDAAAVPAGSRIRARLAKGELDCRVEKSREG